MAEPRMAAGGGAAGGGGQRLGKRGDGVSEIKSGLAVQVAARMAPKPTR